MGAYVLTRSSFRNYQTAAYEFARRTPRCAVLAGMGSGKTAVAATLARDLMAEFEITKALVVSTVANVTATWPLDLLEWEHLRGTTTTTLREPDTKAINKLLDEEWGKRKDALLLKWAAEAEDKYLKDKANNPHAIKDASYATTKAKAWRSRWFDRQRSRWYRMKAQTPTQLHLINAENFALLCQEMDAETWPYGLVIFDESTLFAGYDAKRLTAFKALAHLPARVILLSGSFFARGLEACWAQVYLMDQGRRLGSTITEFRERFMAPTHIKFKYKPLPDSESRVRGAIKDLCIYIDPTEHLNTVEDIRQDVYVTLPTKAQALVTKLADELFLALDSGVEIEAQNAAVLLNKMRQACNGFFYTDDQGGYEVLHDSKIDMLKQIIEEVNAPVLVAIEFKADKARLLKAIKGAVMFDKSRGMVERWNKGKIKVMLVSPLAGMHGLNLQHGGNHMVWFNPIWSLELTEQLEARIGKVRQAQAGYNRPTFYYRILDDGRTESRVLTRLRELDIFQSTSHDYFKVEIA